MSFLLDSVMDELRESKLEVHLVLHPTYVVERDKDGNLLSAIGQKRKAKRSERQESLIHIHVTRIDTEDARQELQDRLNLVLKDVRSAVQDFKAMHERLYDAIDAYKTSRIEGTNDELWEAIHFLEWLAKDNFIFLGMREYKFEGGVEEGELSPHEGTGLGLLADPNVRVLRRGREFVQITPEIREFLMKPEPLIIAKANVKSRVHRRVHMDYIGAKIFDDDGAMVGELRIVGLFASTAYTEPTSTIPFLRRKVASVLARAGHDPDSHSGRALINVMESFPRDELFQIDKGTPVRIRAGDPAAFRTAPDPGAFACRQIRPLCFHPLFRSARQLCNRGSAEHRDVFRQCLRRPRVRLVCHLSGRTSGASALHYRP